MNSPFDLIGVLFWIHQVLYWAYLWQIKEYRLDRMTESFSSQPRKILVQQFNIKKWYRPQPTIRVILSLLVTIIPVSLRLYFGPATWFSLLLITPFWTTLAIAIWTPLFIWLKKRLINQAKLKMSNFKGLVIGVTGSFGKSSTKQLLAHLLSSKYKVGYTPENINSEIGVAQTVLKLSGDEDIFVVEMGAYKIGEIKAVCQIVKPKIGIITGLGNQHLALFGSLNNIKKAKHELINSLPSNGLGLVAQKNFSLKEASHITQTKTHLSFTFAGTNFKLPLLGKQIVRNVIGSIKVGQYLGLNLDDISQTLATINPSLFWPKLIKVTPKLAIVDDSYNASLESFLSLLEYTKVWPNFKKILITPGIIELGDAGSNSHQIIRKNLIDTDKIFLTDRQWAKELNINNKTEIETNPKKLINKIKKEIDPKTLLIFKGRIPRVVIDSFTNAQSF